MFDDPVTDVGVTPGGEQVVATDAGFVKAWQDGTVKTLHRPERRETSPEGPEVLEVAVSESGRQLLWVLNRNGGSTVVLQDEKRGQRFHRDVEGYVRHGVIDRGEVMVLDSGYGLWMRLDLSLARVLSRGDAGIGNHNYAAAVAPDGRSFTYTNSAPSIPVWRTQGSSPDRGEEGGLHGRGPGVFPKALALSGEARRLAVVDSGTIYLSRPTPGASGTSDYRDVLTGFARAGVSDVAFLGGPDRLASTSDDLVAVWDVAQHARTATLDRATVGFGCVACPGPVVRVSGGSRIAYVTDSLTNPVIHDLADGSELTAGDDFGTWGPQLWDGSDTVIQGYANGTIGFIDAASGQLKKEWPAVSARGLIALSWLEAGRRLASVDDEGVLRVRDSTSGRLLRTWRPPKSWGEFYPRPRSVAVDDSGRHIAFAIENRVEVVDTSTGDLNTLRYDENERGQLTVEYTAGLLMVATLNALEAWDSAGATLRRRLEVEPNLAGPISDPSFTTIAYQRQDGRVVVLDVASEEEIGSFAVPASIEALKSGLAFDPVGSALYVVTEGTGDKGQIQRWELTPEALIDSLCAASGRCSADDRAAESGTYR